MSKTPIEIAAEALTRQAHFIDMDNEDIARAVFESIPEEWLAAEIHARFNECRGRNGVSPTLLATALKASLLTGGES